MPNSNSHNREEAISKALEDLSTDRYPTVTAATHIYALPMSTLTHRFHGRQSRVLGHEAYQLLSPNEEATLEGWIRRQCRHRCPPTYDMLQNMVNMILQSQHTSTVPLVGQNWPKAFLNRHPKLKLKRIRTIAQQRHLGTTRPIIQQWFVDFIEVIRSYGIKEENMWNMDEKGFGMGLSKSQKTIVATDSPNVFLMKPENRT